VRRVVVHIDRLVLRGFRHEERQAVAEGLRAALIAGWDAEAAAAGSEWIANASSLRLGRFAARGGAAPADIGAAAGRGIAGGLRR
jgi:hypothetical protein